MTKIFDILDKLDFFNQRAGRELWQSKPEIVQNQDIANFSSDIKKIREFIAKQQAEIEALKLINNTYVATTNEIREIVVKEFAQRLKSLVNQHHYMLANIHNSRDFGMFTVGFEQAIDNIVKEMVGDNSNE